MKDSYAPGFWCATTALGLITATYFYGVVQAHQIEQALVFYNSALGLIGVLAMAVLAWSAHENAQLKNDEKPRATPWYASGTPRLPYARSRRCSTVISGAATGNPGARSRR